MADGCSKKPNKQKGHANHVVSYEQKQQILSRIKEGERICQEEYDHNSVSSFSDRVIDMMRECKFECALGYIKRYIILRHRYEKLDLYSWEQYVFRLLDLFKYYA